MREQEAVRRLVKSPPELWEQCSDPGALARHLSGFGEIRITRLEPESTVAWEGESASGTVSLEVSGWGTQVRLTAERSAEAATAQGESAEAATSELSLEEIAAQASPARLLLAEPAAPRGLGALIGLIRRRRLSEAVRPSAPAEATSPPAAAAPEQEPAGDLTATLEAALDSLGAAHHRPYSR